MRSPRSSDSRSPWPRCSGKDNCNRSRARDLVPGDRIVLEGGDNIPADSRLLEGVRPSRPGSRPDGGVGPRGQGRRGRARGADAAGRPDQHGLPGHDRRGRQGGRGRRRHGLGHRAWADRRLAPAHRARTDSAPETARRTGEGADRHRAGDRRPHLPAPRTARRAAPAVIPALGQPRRGRGPGRPSRGRDAGAGDRLAAPGAAQRPGAKAAERRDAGLRHGHLLGQDRHTDPQRNDGARDRHRECPPSGQRDGL